MSSSAIRHWALAIVAAVGLAAAASAADVLTQLGLNAASAKELLMSEVGSGWLNYGAAAGAFKKAPVALRVELVQGAIAWAKTFTASPDFKASYAKLRETRKPEAPKFQGTPEEEYAKQREQQAKDQAKGAEDMKEAMASMPPDQRKQMEEAMRQAAEVVKQMDTPEMRKMMLDGIRLSREQQATEYTADMKKWNEEYPENPNPVIAKRLKAFLDMSADVDFDAKLVQKNGKMRFVNETYESQPSEWKVCYRVGKEPVLAARAAAAAWMKELGR
jgi:hypothetical protein